MSVTFSIPTLDRDIWRLTEPGTPPPRQRLRAVRTLVDAGVSVGVGIAPIIPGLSDRPDLLEDVVVAARDAGASSVWANVLYLRPGTREHFLDNLARDWPELLPRYARLYADRAYLPDALTRPVRQTVARLVSQHGLAADHGPRRTAAAVRRPAARRSRTAWTDRDAARLRALTEGIAGGATRYPRSR